VKRVDNDRRRASGSESFCCSSLVCTHKSDGKTEPSLVPSQLQQVGFELGKFRVGGFHTFDFDRHQPAPTSTTSNDDHALWKDDDGTQVGEADLDVPEGAPRHEADDLRDSSACASR
jgi:hypothetical protein